MRTVRPRNAGIGVGTAVFVLAGVATAAPEYISVPYVGLPVAALGAAVAYGLSVWDRQTGQGATESQGQPVSVLDRPGMTSLAVPEVVASVVRGRDRLVDELTGLYRWGARSEARVRVLHGMGGVGKTTIAQLVGKRLEARGVRVWWISAASVTGLQTEMRILAGRLGATGAEIERAWSGHDSAPDLVWRLLDRYSGRWALIIDNADDTRLLAPADEPLSAGRGWIRSVSTRRGMLLITTRDGDAATWPVTSEKTGKVPGSGTWYRLEPVGMLSPEDGAAVLLGYAGEQAGSTWDAVALAHRLGLLPLALSLAGRALAEARALRIPGVITTFVEYQKAVDTGEAAILKEPVGPLTEARARSVIVRTWELSLDLLDARGLPTARILLRLLATYADAPIPTVLMDPTILADSPLLPGLESDGLCRLLQAVIGQGLVDHDDDSATLRLHPLIRDASRVRLYTTGQRGDYLALAVLLLNNAAHGDPEDREEWPTWQTLTPHAFHLLAAAVQIPDADPGLIDTIADIASRASRYLGAAGLYANARDQLADLLPIRQRFQGPEHPKTLTTRHDLAFWTGEAGDPAAARDGFADLLPIREQVLGAEHPDVLATRHELAFWTGEAGDPAAARDGFADLLSIQDRILGSEDPGSLMTRHNLARWTGEAGDPATACEQYSGLLPIQERIQGAGHPDVLATRHNLAFWTGEAGDPAAARDQLATLLPIRERVQGPEHPDTLYTRQTLARWAGEAGDPAVARDQLADQLSIQERVQGVHHPRTLDIRHNLARWTGEAGDPGGARSQYADLLPIQERVQGVHHPRTLTIRHNLAFWTGAAGDPAGARDQLADLLPIQKQVHGRDHPDVLVTRHNLAFWTGEAGDPGGARDQLADLLPILEQVHGCDHPRTLTTRHELARWIGAAEDPAAARAPGRDHADVLVTRHELARWTRRADGS